MIARAFQTHRVIRSTALIAITTALGGVFALGGCSDDATPGSGTGGTSGSGGSSSGGSSGSGGACTGGPVTGPADTHCGATKTATGICQTDVPAADAGPSGDAGPPTSDYGDTMVGTEADDDDCKYHVKYTVTPVCDAAGATFTVTVTTTTDGKPVTGASARIEAFLDDTHLSPSFNPKSTEKAGGVYDIGPVKFDKPGKWTVRFHFFETCADEPADSPHGHAAFFINVP
jgi:YtkA-like